MFLLVAHNTNECLAAVTGMAVCEETSWLGLPTRECCRGLKEIIVRLREEALIS